MSLPEPTELGKHYRDKASGFVGVAVGRAEYLYEESSVLLIAETKQAAADSRWIPETRIEPFEHGSTGFAS